MLGWSLANVLAVSAIPRLKVTTKKFSMWFFAPKTWRIQDRYGRPLLVYEGQKEVKTLTPAPILVGLSEIANDTGVTVLFPVSNILHSRQPGYQHDASGGAGGKDQHHLAWWIDVIVERLFDYADLTVLLLGKICHKKSQQGLGRCRGL